MYTMTICLSTSLQTTSLCYDYELIHGQPLTTFVCTSVNLTCLTCVLLEVETMYARTHTQMFISCVSML